MSGLTPIQERTLDLIRSEVRTRGRAPTYREIAGACDISPGTAYKHVVALEKKGRLRRTGRRYGLVLQC